MYRTLSHFKCHRSSCRDINHKIYGTPAVATKSRYKLVTVTIKIQQFSLILCVAVFAGVGALQIAEIRSR